MDSQARLLVMDAQPRLVLVGPVVPFSPVLYTAR